MNGMDSSKGLRDVTVNLARSTRNGDLALDMVTEISRNNALGLVPDVGMAHAALTAWGIPFTEGPPIHRMVGSTRSLLVTLPPGWEISQRGGGGHNNLLDANGVSRIHWHIHGWDPVALDVEVRFKVIYRDISASEGVVQIADSENVIHTLSVKYPHTRVAEPYGAGKVFYTCRGPGWTDLMARENYRLKDSVEEAGRIWLDTNRPGHNDRITAWML